MKDWAPFRLSHLKSWCHKLLQRHSTLRCQVPSSQEGILGLFNSIHCRSSLRPWEDKRSREKAFYRVLTKQKLKGIFGTGNSDLYGTSPKGKVKGRDSGRQMSRVHGNSNLRRTFHTRPANCRARAAGVIMFSCNQPSCDNLSGYINKKTGTQDYECIWRLSQVAESTDIFWATKIYTTQ